MYAVDLNNPHLGRLSAAESIASHLKGCHSGTAVKASSPEPTAATSVRKSVDPVPHVPQPAEELAARSRPSLRDRFAAFLSAALRW